jgi:hypothetical protein
MAEMLLVFSVHFYFCKGRGEVDQAGGQHWAQSDCIDGGSGQGSASGALHLMCINRRRSLLLHILVVHPGVLVLVVHLVRGCSSWWHIWIGGVHLGGTSSQEVCISNMTGGFTQREKARRWLMLLRRLIKRWCIRMRWGLKLRLNAVFKLILTKVKILSKTRKKPPKSSRLRY